MSIWLMDRRLTVKVGLMLCACLLVGYSLWTQVSAEPVVINYTSGNLMNCLALHNGLVWIGTTGGLVRFNPETGERLKFTPADSRGSCAIAHIAIDSRGVLWASHEDLYGNSTVGLLEFDGIQWQSGYSAMNVYNIAADELGYVWFLYGADMMRFDGTSFRSWSLPYYQSAPELYDSELDASQGKAWSIIRERVYTFDGFDVEVTDTPIQDWYFFRLAADRGHGAWLANGDGLWRFEDQSYTSYRFPNGDKWTWVQLVRVDNSSTKWVVGRIYGDWEDHGDAASLSKDGVWRVYRNVWPSFLDIGGRVEDLRFDASNAAWVLPSSVLTDQNEERPFLIRYDGQSLESFWAFDPVVGTIAERLCIDDGGSVWFTSLKKWYTVPRYLTRWDGGDVDILWPGRRELPDKINSMACAPDGDVWFGTDEGAYRFDGRDWDESLPARRVSEVKIGPDGQVLAVCYVSDYARVVRRFDGDRWITEYEPDWSGQEISDVALDSKGVLWVSCGSSYEDPPYDYAGIRSWDGEKERKYELGCEYSAIVVDDDDVVWATCGYITEIANGRVTRRWYKADLGGCGAAAPLFVDSQNRKWCQGLQYEADSYHYQPGLLSIDGDEQVQFYSTTDGLCSGEINDIDEDSYGNIWVSTERGISVLLAEESFHLEADAAPDALKGRASLSYLGPPTSVDLYVAIQAPSGQLFYVAPQGAAPPFPIFYAAFDGSTEFLEPGPSYSGPGSIPNTPDMKDLAAPALPRPDPPDGNGPTGLALFAYPVPYFANVPLPAYGAID
ncbi:MAG TPA: two-component regulator propeller domain-containing protein, partial [bacterium]|nr:two-component regulator propeller domain-containing protein [bacterium]